MAVILKGWKYVGFVAGIVGFIGVAIYPIVIAPLMNVDKYKEIQKRTRQGIDQEKIQPGNMKVWSDPFGRK